MKNKRKMQISNNKKEATFIFRDRVIVHLRIIIMHIYLKSCNNWLLQKDMLKLTSCTMGYHLTSCEIDNHLNLHSNRSLKQMEVVSIKRHE